MNSSIYLSKYLNLKSKLNTVVYKRVNKELQLMITDNKYSGNIVDNSLILTKMIDDTIIEYKFHYVIIL